MLRSDLCDFHDANIVAKDKINVTRPNNVYDKKISF